MVWVKIGSISIQHKHLRLIWDGDHHFVSFFRRQVAFAVEKSSKKLEVNDLKTKVRRLEALPEYDETTPSRTVVVLNLPMERPTIEG